MNNLNAHISAAAADSDLRDIEVDRIDRNPENPRLVFRSGDLEELLVSIRRYGVQVPISVYKEGARYVLIDGERRWICCQKLGKKTIPALIQEKPSALTNLLLMFNIHALREQWDYLTISMKLPRVISLLQRELGHAPNERDLSDYTGLSRGAIRRCRLIIELPEKYKDDILEELNKPKPQQKLTEDFFIEMERALKTVGRAMPGVIDHRDRVRRVLIHKYKTGVIENRVHFRFLAKIARAERVQADKTVARAALRRVFQRNEYSIAAAYRNSVAEAYSERDLGARAKSLIGQLEELEVEHIDRSVREALERLYLRLREVLGKR
jgi:ParB family transcriptional regulator, chromosome partitioning protein